MVENKRLRLIIGQIIKKQSITRKDAVFLSSPQVDIWDLLYGANVIKRHFTNSKIRLCSIINAKSGDCSEDCKFCAQSVFHNTNIKTYPLVNAKIIKKAYDRAGQMGADGFSIVTSGDTLSDKEVAYLGKILRELHQRNSNNPYICFSIGHLTKKHIEELKNAGLTKCHHNLETSRKFFPKICSTHSYDKRIETIKHLKEARVNICSGGVFGIGEKWDDRIDLAFTLKKLNVDSVPLNFLMPIKGTPLGKIELLSPIEALRIIALFRYILIDKDIRICAGREKVLRDLQSLIFYAGANGMMIGGYLTQLGRTIRYDLQMIKDLGLQRNKL
ncbi:MAG: biotin synthase BioB [Planctomycetota bacterium]